MKSWKRAKIINKYPLIVKSRQRGDVRELYSWEDDKHIFYELCPIGKAENDNAVPAKLPNGYEIMEHDSSGVLSIYRKDKFKNPL